MARLALAAAVAAAACICTLTGCGSSSSSSSSSSSGPPPPTQGARRPNIVLILSDDQGYADVGYQGAEGFTTPNIDWMAAHGMRFTDFYMGASVCTPARAALLTGCYPQRVGLPGVLFPKSRVGLNPDETTMAEILRVQGYATAAVGKWHLGDDPDFLPLNHGFDEWFGIPVSSDMRAETMGTHEPRKQDFPPLALMRGNEVVAEDPDHSQLTKLYTDEAVDFIRRQKDRPFFLYLAHTAPHVPLFPGARFQGKTTRGDYGDVIEELDWSVGQVLAELEKQGIENNTLVIFTSDNGPWLVQGFRGGSAEPLREGKLTTFEGGHRVPCVMLWPGKIPAGRTCRTMTTAMDLLPTITTLCGGTLPGTKIDGRDVSALLLDEKLPGAEEHPLFYYTYDNLEAVRVGRYKLHVPHVYGSIHGAILATATSPGRPEVRQIELSLFDLETDIGETTNIASKHPQIVNRLLTLCQEARTDLGDGPKRKGQGVRPPGRLQ